MNVLSAKYQSLGESFHQQAWRSGFTLLQLVLLLALLVTLAIVAAVNIWSAINTYRLHSAVAAMVADIRYAQHMARTRSGWYGVRFIAQPTNSYMVYATDGSSDTAVTMPQNPAQALQIDIDADFGGVTISAVDIGGGTQVEFDPQGTPYTDKSGAPIAADGSVTIAIGGQQKVIRIVKNTGRVETP